MNYGQAITAAIRDQRRKDLVRGCHGHWGYEHMYRIQAWCMWGWGINDWSASLGRPGL